MRCVRLATVAVATVAAVVVPAATSFAMSPATVAGVNPDKIVNVTVGVEIGNTVPYCVEEWVGNQQVLYWCT